MSGSIPDRPVVAIGGGHGLARTLEALRVLRQQPTAIVSVADDGGSSGRLRRAHDVVALGDLRMALETLATDVEASGLFGHRFAAGELAGHALGNLTLLALLEQHDGDLVAALDHAGRLLGVQGRVLPCTTASVHLGAAVDGADVSGQVAIATTPGRKQRVWLDPADPPPCDVALEAIGSAGAIVLGPGSLYTSIIPNLLVKGIAAAVAAADAPVLYVANLTTQPGETAGMSLQDHVDALLAHLPGRRTIRPLVHAGPVPSGPGEPLGDALTGPRVEAPARADVACRREDGTVGAGHDPARLAAALAVVLDGVLPLGAASG